MTVEFPPFDADSTRPRTIGRRLVTMVCVLALVFLGLALLSASHASQLDGSQSVAAAVHGDGHCPEPMYGATDPGHSCASIHGHACCMLIEPSRADSAAAKQLWGHPHEPRRTAVVIAPIPRPPAHLAA